MHTKFSEEILLGAEATVGVDLEGLDDDSSPEWTFSRGDALDVAEREAWTRHAARAAGFGAASFGSAAVEDDGSHANALTDAVRRVLDLDWD